MMTEKQKIEWELFNRGTKAEDFENLNEVERLHKLCHEYVFVNDKDGGFYVTKEEYEKMPKYWDDEEEDLDLFERFLKDHPEYAE